VLQKTYFYAKSGQVTAVKLNVICCLSKMMMEKRKVTWWQENSCDVWVEEYGLGKELLLTG